MNLKPIVRSRISETCIEASKVVRMVTSLVLIEERMIAVIWLDCHNILAMWRNHFSQLFSVQGVSNVKPTEIHSA
jgi:hypothetical protein